MFQEGKKMAKDDATNNIETIRRYDMEQLTGNTKGRSPVVYEYCGVRKTVKEWSEFLGLATPQAFYMRLLAYKKGEATEHEIFQPAAPQAGHRKRRRHRAKPEQRHARRAGDKRAT